MPGPGITQYVLKGGPCDGKIGTMSPEVEQSGQLTCQDHVYKRTGQLSSGVPREIFQDHGAVPKPKQSVSTPHAHHGWQSLRKSINHTMPSALRKASKSQAAALRSLGRASRVR